MTKREAPYQAPEGRMLEEGDPRTQAYGYYIRSRGLSFKNDVLDVEVKHKENRKKSTVSCDFSKVLLPPNRLHPCVTLLKDRPELARIVVAVVDTYVIRQQLTKSTASTAMSLARDTVRFLEYCWLNDLYRLADLTPVHWNAFLEKYVKGGWPLALDLERRAAQVDLRSLSMQRRKHKKGVVEYSCASLLEAIGTNLGDNQLRLEYSRGDTTGILRRARGDEALSESAVAQVVSHLNELSAIPSEMRAPSLAHINPYLFAASSNATPPNRTENFEPRQLAMLMREAFRWVKELSAPIVRLAKAVYAPLSEANPADVDEIRMLRLLEAPETKQLEALLTVRITSVRRVGDLVGGLGLLGLMRMFLAASFLLLGVFNARRKDEVQGRSIGVYADGFECLAEDLGIYQSYFYCEKGTRDYRLFFINEVSFRALQATKDLSDLAWETAARNGGVGSEGQARKLFCMPPRSQERAPTFYDYSTDPGVGLLIELATGVQNTTAPNSQMFRRAYAAVFFHRYENSDLYALAQQLDHKDLGMVLHYVLDGPSRVLAHHAATLWGDGGETKRARAVQAAGLAAEIRDYSKVKLHDDVLEILMGAAPVAGRFVKLVHRFVSKLYGRIKYDHEDLRKAAQGVSDVLVGRGHTVLPLPHGNCNAGSARPGAACFHNGRLARERASPLVCGGCTYHSLKAAHIRAIQDDLELQRQESTHGGVAVTIQRQAADRALQATEKLVAFYVRKLAEPTAAS